MEEKKYTVMSDSVGKYIDIGGEEYTMEGPIPVPIWMRHVPIKRIIDPENWEVGEVVSDKDYHLALTGSATHIRRVL